MNVISVRFEWDVLLKSVRQKFLFFLVLLLVLYYYSIREVQHLLYYLTLEGLHRGREIYFQLLVDKFGHRCRSCYKLCNSFQLHSDALHSFGIYYCQ